MSAEPLTSHALANALLAGPDLPIGLMQTCDYFGLEHRDSHGAVEVAVIRRYSGEHVVLGTMWDGAKVNDSIAQMIIGDLPRPWPRWVPGKGHWEFAP